MNKVALSKFEHAFVVAVALGTPGMVHEKVIVELNPEQRELVIRGLRNFIGGLTQKLQVNLPSN
jgi:hypothetical protein